jgi:hypothetical protein
MVMDKKIYHEFGAVIEHAMVQKGGAYFRGPACWKKFAGMF